MKGYSIMHYITKCSKFSKEALICSWGKLIPLFTYLHLTPQDFSKILSSMLFLFPATCLFEIPFWLHADLKNAVPWFLLVYNSCAHPEHKVFNTHSTRFMVALLHWTYTSLKRDVWHCQSTGN